MRRTISCAEQVRDQAEHEQDHRQVGQRRRLQRRRRALVLVGDAGSASVSAEPKIDEGRPSVPPITWLTAIASPSGAGEAEHDGGDEPARSPAGWPRCAPSPSGSSRARARRALRSPGTLSKSSRLMLAHDRDDHDRQDQAGGQQADVRRRAREQRDEAEVVVQPRLDVGLEERPHDEDPPQAEHDARDRGQELDQHPDRRAQPRVARARSGRGRSRSRSARR